MIHEMVHIEVNWFEPNQPLPKLQPFGDPDRLWFKVVDGQIIPIEHPRYYKESIFLYGSMKFTPMQTDGEFYITPYKSNLDVVLDTMGIDETFGAGDDLQRLAAIALQRRNAPYAGVEELYFTAIALYSVYVYTTHTEDGNDSETEYELLGILDTKKLPLALAAPEPVTAPIIWPASPPVCSCETFTGSGWNCDVCGGGRF